MSKAGELRACVVDKMKKCSTAVYLACEEPVAKDISRILVNGVTEITALQERIEKLEWAVKYLDSVLLPHQVSDTRRSKIKALLNKGE